jgi:prolyl-tRNA editing enzyme YbaK/EbsC (Cys-tRNA(Pro) deacylase)
MACPPFGHSTQLRVFVDPDLRQYDEVWAAAGTWNDNFGAAPATLFVLLVVWLPT